MTFAKILIMTILVSVMFFSIYKFAISLRSYIKAKKDKQNKAQANEVSTNENINKEVV